jgi:hypothetical protein
MNSQTAQRTKKEFFGISRGYWWLATLVAFLGFLVSAGIFYAEFPSLYIGGPGRSISPGELFFLGDAGFFFQLSMAPAVIILLIGWAKTRELLRVSRGDWWSATSVAFLGFLVSTFLSFLLVAMQGPPQPGDLYAGPVEFVVGIAEWVLPFDVVPVVLVLVNGWYGARADEYRRLRR